jgi:hypothetical protein
MPEDLSTDHPPHGHTVTIVVNGRPVVVEKGDLSFTEIVALAFPQGTIGGNTIYTVTYRRGQGQKPEGTLVEGETLKDKDGMIINVTPTDKS